jgi:hypothetical protein
VARSRRWSHQYVLILLLLAAAPARAQTRPAGPEVGIDVGFAPLVTSFGDSVTGYAANAHGGWETRFGLAVDVEMGLASWSSNFSSESAFWFSPGLRYTAQLDRFGFFASSHLGYGHIDANAVTGVTGGGLAIDFRTGLLVHGTPEVAFGPMVGFTHIDLFRTVPILASELWYEIGAGLLITLRP